MLNSYVDRQLRYFGSKWQVKVAQLNFFLFWQFPFLCKPLHPPVVAIVSCMYYIDGTALYLTLYRLAWYFSLIFFFDSGFSIVIIIIVLRSHRSVGMNDFSLVSREILEFCQLAFASGVFNGDKMWV